MYNRTTSTHLIISSITKQIFLFLLIIFSSHTRNLQAQNWNELIKTVASDRGTNDRFGYSVAIDGDYAIVGAYLEDNLYGSGGQSYKDAGAAYILSNKSGKWTVVQKITSKDNAVEDMFGYAVELTENKCTDTSLCVEISSLGIIENEIGLDLMIFPNPTTGNLSIDLGNVCCKSEISIADFRGKVIEHQSFFNSQKINLSITESPGIYIVNIIADGRKAVIKVIKD